MESACLNWDRKMKLTANQSVGSMSLQKPAWGRIKSIKMQHLPSCDGNAINIVLDYASDIH